MIDIRERDMVSVLFNESKLLKSAFQHTTRRDEVQVSVLFNESKLLKSPSPAFAPMVSVVSVLFNESKLLKWMVGAPLRTRCNQFQYSSTSRNC